VKTIGLKGRRKKQVQERSSERASERAKITVGDGRRKYRVEEEDYGRVDKGDTTARGIE
jgi:hypothetical protein